MQEFVSKISNPGRRRKINRYLIQICFFFGFASVLFGIKLWVIGSYGNATPFWDQWDAEAALLYEPFLKGTLTWANLIAPHNEHRIVTTRLLALGLLTLNGIWNPLFQMVVNAIIHIIGLGLIVALLVRPLGHRYLPSLLLFSIILFGVPYGHDNILAGFQSSFYFVLLFSIVSLWLTVTSTPLSIRWCAGVVSGIAAFLSLASGIFALAAAAAIGLLHYLLKVRKTGKQFFAIGILVGLFALGAYLTPSLPGHAQLKAASISQFFEALSAILGWPVSSNIFSVIICTSPAFIFLAGMLRKRPAANDPQWFLLALIFWMIGQAASIAYGRAVGHLASRYLDLFAIGILANFACLILIRRNCTDRWNKLANLGMMVWVAAILISLGNHTDQVRSELIGKRNTGFTQEINTRNYLASGDFNHLKGKAFLDVPYPNPEHFASILASPVVRAFLPSKIRTPLNPVWIKSEPAGAFMAEGYFRTTPKRESMTFGSYGRQGNLAIGRALLEFNSTSASNLAIPVAGYPLSPGIKLEMEQDGRRHPLLIEKQPKESWGVVYAKVNNGPFYIELTDGNPSFWVAIGAPSVVGRLDALTNCLVGSNFLFVMVGFWVILLLMLWPGREPNECYRH